MSKLPLSFRYFPSQTLLFFLFGRSAVLQHQETRGSMSIAWETVMMFLYGTHRGTDTRKTRREDTFKLWMMMNNHGWLY
ncbi:hypothetical protein B0H67DRAFT_211849 [Lasiosphaeris hirsuta]|uniref:Uncharacterized protein n=1 Tax=Lasiosphaeris hirsuta TaxID=260670 RepID=A0AA40ASA7_9PEZI|nr:hypothetical protein B0H67DRAFT_211849 [Lasiosphaeris hirsuta]